MSRWGEWEFGAERKGEATEILLHVVGLSPLEVSEGWGLE